MIRVSPTKLLLKAEDAQEYERHKASWNASVNQQNAASTEKSRQMNDQINHMNGVRARVGITPSTGISK